MDLDNLKDSSGVYALVLFVSKDVTVSVGKLGKHSFPRGYYTYVGSALGKGATNLKNRIERHQRKHKRLFWHIDYLLENEQAEIRAVVAAQTNEKMECNVNGYLKHIEDALVPVVGFGSSDCKGVCGSHLLFFTDVSDTDFLVQKLKKYCETFAKACFVKIR
ncbi:MAG: GIY-YIG nuclease family protein [Candidatus Bathyarchaeota archaeon]|nr:GIY-YIG nuclease family protein [Candidatus Bathyarchaeota archaeon]